MPAVSYTFYPGGNDAPVTLGDDAAGNIISGGLPQSNPQVERRPIAGSAYGLVIEHLNDAPTLTWTVEWNLGTLDAAVNFKNTHAQSIGVNMGIAQGVLAETLDDGTSNFFQNCSRPKVEIVKWVGQSVTVKYTVQYGYVTETLNAV
ncbi:MAG TPA: hypothetical protein VGN23_07515 [Verrucomicrobiae bacterium]|jgi:hypothetical protein